MLDSGIYPWSAVGRVNLSIGGFCTGVAVGPRLVLTAAHCLWDAAGAEWLPAESIRFLPGYGSAYGAVAMVAAPLVVRYTVPDPTRPPEPLTTELDRDWALLLLSDDLDAQTGEVPILATDARGGGVLVQSGTRLIQAGYSEDQPERLTTHDGCRFLGVLLDRLATHDCDAVKGDSGSPIFIERDGQFWLVAMQLAYREDDGKPIGIALLSGEFAADARRLRDDWDADRVGER